MSHPSPSHPHSVQEPRRRHGAQALCGCRRQEEEVPSRRLLPRGQGRYGPRRRRYGPRRRRKVPRRRKAHIERATWQRTRACRPFCTLYTRASALAGCLACCLCPRRYYLTFACLIALPSFSPPTYLPTPTTYLLPTPTAALRWFITQELGALLAKKTDFGPSLIFERHHLSPLSPISLSDSCLPIRTCVGQRKRSRRTLP